MPDLQIVGQLTLTGLAALVFLVAFAFSAARSERRVPTIGLAILGIVVTGGALAWRSAHRGNWLPLEDNFDAILWLAILTAGVSVYLQWRRTMGRVEWVLLPIVIVLLALAAIFGATVPRSYTHSAWFSIHLSSVFASSVAFALAAATGVMYLMLNARLRNKHATVDARFGSLERLERATFNAVSIGFAMLTVGLITGMARAIGSETRLGSEWFLQPKVVMATSAYVLYALVLHSPINPSFRGKKTAVLSIAGFVLLLGTLGIVQAMR